MRIERPLSIFYKPDLPCVTNGKKKGRRDNLISMHFMTHRNYPFQLLINQFDAFKQLARHAMLSIYGLRTYKFTQELWALSSESCPDDIIAEDRHIIL
jgi:hypothetical protein